MGKATHNKKKNPDKEILTSYETGGYSLKHGTKIVWNWTSASAAKIDADNYLYVTIKIIYRKNDKVYFKIHEDCGTNYSHCIDTMINDGIFNLRPYKVNPRTNADLDPKFNKHLMLNRF